LHPLVKAHRPTLQAVIVWIQKGYESTAALIPKMIPLVNKTYNHSLVVFGFEPTENPYESESAMMLFPQYHPIYGKVYGKSAHS